MHSSGSSSFSWITIVMNDHENAQQCSLPAASSSSREGTRLEEKGVCCWVSIRWSKEIFHMARLMCFVNVGGRFPFRANDCDLTWSMTVFNICVFYIVWPIFSHNQSGSALSLLHTEFTDLFWSCDLLCEELSPSAPLQMAASRDMEKSWNHDPAQWWHNLVIIDKGLKYQQLSLVCE